MHIIPRELLALIFEHFRRTSTVSEYKRTLLVCTEWLSVGRPSLYYDILLHSHNLARFISLAATIHWQHIKSLTLSIHDAQPDCLEMHALRKPDYQELAMSSGTRAYQELRECLQNFGQCLPHMTRLSSFALVMTPLKTLAQSSGEDSEAIVITDERWYALCTRNWIPRDQINAMLVSLPRCCESVNIDAPERFIRGASPPSLSDTSLAYAVSTVRRLRVNLEHVDMQLFLTDAPVNTTLQELIIVLPSGRNWLHPPAPFLPRTNSTAPTNDTSKLLDERFRQHFSALEKCYVLRWLGAHQQWRFRQWDGIMRWNVLSNVATFYPIIAVAERRWTESAVHAPRDPGFACPFDQCEYTKVYRERIWMLRLGRKDEDRFGSLEALLSDLESHSWTEVSNGCCLPKVTADDGWARERKTSIVRPEGGESRKSSYDWLLEKEERAGQRLLLPEVRQADERACSPLSLTLPRGYFWDGPAGALCFFDKEGKWTEL